MKEKYYFVMHGINIFLYWLTLVVVLVVMVLSSNIGIVYIVYIILNMMFLVINTNRLSYGCFRTHLHMDNSNYHSRYVY